ncbi:MAG TPA: sigma factor [Mycobacteriales bacterium]|nr:sigma factor [Mycobacteriales bacterium]
MTFEEFAEARLQALLRYATVPTADPQLAQDLVQDVMVRMQGRWRKIEQYDRPERYVRRAIANAYVSWRRRWSVRNLVPFSAPPERIVPDVSEHDTGRSELWQQLRSRASPG